MSYLDDILNGRERRKPTSNETRTCERCGVTYGVGASPWCRDGHEGGASVKHPDVTYPGGLTLWNLGPTAVTVYSESERKTLMKERGLREGVWHVPEPGSDKSKITKSWATADAYTLEQAALLVARVAQAKATEHADGSLQTLSVGWSDAPVATFAVQREG